MISNLKSFFTAPVFEDQEKTHHAYLLHMIVRALIFTPFLYLLYKIIMAPHEISRAIVQVIFAEVINFVLLYLIKNGQIRGASYLHVISFWLLITATAATSSGVSDEAYFLGYPLVIIISGILLGVRISSFVTILSIIAGGYMVYAEKAGTLINTGASSSESLWILTVIIFPLLVVLQYLSSHTIRVALHRAHASEDKYRLVSSLSSDYIYETVIDDHGVNKMNWVGGAFEKITGYTYEEYVATGGWLGHIHPDDIEKDAQDLAALSRNERVKSDIRTITKNGELHWSRISALPVWNEKTNKMTGIIGSVQDVTKIKMAEEAEKEALQHQASMVQNIPDMAWLKDRDSRYLAVNEKFASTSGRKIEEIVGKTDYDLWEESFARAYREDDAIVIQSQKLRRIEEKQRDYLGNEYWVETIKTPIFNSSGAVIGTTGIARDITERKEAELKQQRRRELLEKVIHLGKIVTKRDNLKETIKKIWHGVHDMLGFDRQVIFLYNFETNMMDDTFGTDNNGQMLDNWHLSFPIGEGSTFAKLLEKPDGFYFSENYDQEDNNIDEKHDMYGVKHFAAVAAWSGDKPVAIICTDNLITQRPISDEQLEALRLFAGYAGLAIENSRLYEAVQNELNQQKLAEERERERRAILEKVVKLGQSVTEVNDLRTTLEIIWRGVRADLGFDRVATFLYNPDQISMDGTFGTNNEGEMTDEWNVRYLINDVNNLGTLPFRRVLEKPDSIYLTRDFETEYGATSPDNIMFGVKDFASIPAWAGDKPVAFISVDNRITGRPITDAQLEGLRLFAGYAGLGIENSRLNNALQNELSLQKNAEARERERRAILEKVVRLGQYVTEVNDLETTLKRIWEGIRKDLGFDRTGIYLYNTERISMDGTFGTGNQGEMLDERHTWVSIKENAPESMSFRRVLETPDSIYLTHTYETDYHTPQEGHIMSGVKDFAAIAARAGEKPVAVICVDHNITGRPISDEQLEALRLFAGYAGLAIENAKLNNALQNELAQRKNFIEELESKNGELERFTYTVSHDLKSPLVTINGFLGYVEKDARAGDFEKLQNNMHRIRLAVDKMQLLLKDLLELSRIGRLINTPVEIPFNNIVKDAVEILQGQIKESGTTIEYHESNLIVKGDHIRLVEVLQNLLENAIKFMGGQPKPHIQVGSLVSGLQQPIFYVKDNGAGIAPEYHEKIFGLFNKLDSDSTGTGIGLALVKRIIEVHGGRIWIESKAGEGTTFYFTLQQPQKEP